MAEEMGLPYEVKPETLGRLSDEFAAINPARALPAVDDGGMAMSESVAILQYLAERYGPTPLAPRFGEPGHTAYLEFLIFGEASLVATQFMAPEEQKSNYTATVARDMFRRRLALVDRQLGADPHLAGEAFTAADISVVYALGLGAMLGLASDYSERIGDYWARMKERPAFKAAAAK